jgi:hypothetical protein
MLFFQGRVLPVEASGTVCLKELLLPSKKNNG